VRGYYLDEDGKDVTKCFSAENEFFCTECFRTGRPSTFFIECLERTRYLAFPYPLVRNLMQSCPELAAHIELLFEREIDKLEKWRRRLSLYSAGERYRIFLAENPLLARRAPLKHVASLLGVRPETLSRIRKSLKIPAN